MNATQSLNVLGIEKKFPIEEATVKKQYRKMAREHHPDAGGSNEKMAEVNEAYDWLLKNLDKVNQTNTRESEPGFKFSQTVHNTKNIVEARDDLADAFIKAYSESTTREQKRLILDKFIRAVELTRDDYLNFKFRQMFK
jgi:DnaJ-class molecular chaperone